MKKKWKPSASIKDLIKRSKIIANIRSFFLKKNVMEVETPTLSQSAVTDINLMPFETNYFSCNNDVKKTKLWLITSPEYHMKRLLSAGSGSIYQICHSFRNQEFGQYHNPEFTMLEWYQISFSMEKMIEEIDFFFQKILNFDKSDKISYQEIFIKFLQIDPLSTNLSELFECCKKFKLEHLTYLENDLNKLIEMLFTLQIQPFLGKEKPLFVYHFPLEQASLSAVNKEDNRVSERFEIFFKGIELGNGFYELTDYFEQKKRFIKDNKKRCDMNFPKQKIDEHFLNAMKNGLPFCSGVAIGLDRLIMIALNKKSIDQVMSFSFDRS
ncbi:elongation factor P--(R)-beta-lysine ligase [Buchnera aphidicola (Rhopalosiphum padi)]|uniref:Elongation factor P--(R)-beta-lysine ligase n=1 Tax=Buchnera aphidicola subsp. Rhopalosiphum padi TaxID=98793 RepID=A0A4D6Y6P3_BUCRP|nr:elongation factor P--(R)-beta-lysine ligase [Buchnera aphidicola]QCI25197.1 elongation factor P--(R)-beta-lysine ligase [Buchnera aphidicola (Rhopalosiphum padi)]